MGKTLYDKVFDAHVVRPLASGQTQLFIGLHLIHEVTSPQAFEMLRDRGLAVPYPDRTVATVDHIVPTEDQSRPYKDDLAEQMVHTLNDIRTQKAALTTSQEEEVKTQTQFQADIDRYRELRAAQAAAIR